MRADAVVSALRRLRDQTGDTYVLAVARIGFGLLLLNEAWLATQQLRGAGYFGGYFHQPFLPEGLVPSEGVYEVLLAAQWIAALLVVAGRGARPALLVASGLLVSTMLCDRLWFHHYRHTMAAFAALLAFTPCDRYFVLGRPPDATPGPLWARSAILAQVSLMYVASAGSKLLDPEWRGGQMMLGMVHGFARMMQARGVPRRDRRCDADAARRELAREGRDRDGALAGGPSLVAEHAQARPLGGALLPPHDLADDARAALHDRDAARLPALYDAGRRRARRAVRPGIATPSSTSSSRSTGSGGSSFVSKEGTAFTVVDRDGEEKHGVRAFAVLFGALPVLFAAWPLVAVAAAFTRGSPRRGP